MKADIKVSANHVCNECSTLIINCSFFVFGKVLNETLRLGNVVRYLHRKAIKDVQYKGEK